MFSTDPVEFNLDALKAKLAIALVEVVRSKKWNQSEAATQLQTTQPRVSNLVRGKLDRFSIDSLLKMWVCSGYKLEADFDPRDMKQPVSLTLKKAAL
jgi:predicted XRE-type DNA-binding protein